MDIVNEDGECDIVENDENVDYENDENEDDDDM